MELKDKKTRITYHNGLRTIGGTIVEVAYEDSHIFFDFGSEYDPSAVKQPNELQSLLDETLLPYLPGVFDPAIPLQGYEDRTTNFQHTAVFLSHVHLDHTKVINYLNPQIPLYTMQETKSLLQTLNINDDFLFPLYGEHHQTTRDIIGVTGFETISVGAIQVTLIPVDHDAYGACGFLIQTPDMRIAYTGDIRLHGYHPEATLRFCEESKGCDVLIMEGVSVSFQEAGATASSEDGACSEAEVLNEFANVIKNNPHRQLTFNYYIANVERILHMMNTCQRTIVLSAYAAYVVKQASGIEPYYYLLESDRDYGLSREKQVSFTTLLQDEDMYLWQLDTEALGYLHQMKEGGLYLHSNATPLGQYDPSYAPFMQAFQNHNIEVKLVSCSGHAHPRDLQDIIHRIEPTLLTPLHSLHPERLHNETRERLLPQKGQTI